MLPVNAFFKTPDHFRRIPKIKKKSVFSKQFLPIYLNTSGRFSKTSADFTKCYEDFRTFSEDFQSFSE